MNRVFLKLFFSLMSTVTEASLRAVKIDSEGMWALAMVAKSKEPDSTKVFINSPFFFNHISGLIKKIQSRSM